MTVETIDGEVILGVRDLAARRGWKPVEDLAAAILSSGQRRDILLLHGGGIDAAPLRKWIQQVADQAEVAAEPIGQAAAPPFRALFAAKLVAVLECGRVLDAAEVQTIAQQLLPRPIESFAIVFTHVERLESSEDLDLMERAIWRVVVPDPKRDWQRQDLLAYQCYFWGASEPREFLRERCRRDSEELAALLRRPLADSDVELLDRGRASFLLDLAEGFAPQRQPRAGGEAGRLRQARNEVAEVRQRLVRRRDEDAAGLARQATASLLKLEQDLLRRLEAVRAGQAGVWKETHVYSTKFPSLLEQSIEEGMDCWRTALEAEVDQRVAEIISETRQLLNRIDWDFVNAIAGRADRPAAEALSISTAPQIPRMKPAAAGGAIEWRERVAGVAGLFGLAAAMSSGVFATLAVSGLLTAVGVGRRARLFEQSARPARKAIHAMIRRAIPELRTAIQAGITDYRDRLSAELRAIETTLEAAYAQEFKVPEESSAAEWDREQLLLYRHRLG